MSQETREDFFSSRVDPLEDKRKEIDVMLNMSVVQQRNIRFNNFRLESAEKLATELIDELKKEYQIE